MGGSPKDATEELFRQLVQGLTAASRSTQLRLFHGVVPALAGLQDAQEGIVTLRRAGWFRGKHSLDAGFALDRVEALIDDAAQIIGARAAELGYPLDRALESYRASGAQINTLEAMKEAIGQAGNADWDRWAATLPGDDSSANS